MTRVAENWDIAVLTAARTAGAALSTEIASESAREEDAMITYRACASEKPLCTWIDLLIPGNRVGLRLSKKKSASVSRGILGYGVRSASSLTGK